MREESFMKIKDNFKEECAYILRLIGASLYKSTEKHATY